MPKNYGLLYELLTEALQILPHVICIAETCIKKLPLSNLDLPNYCFLNVNPKANANGVALYIFLYDNLKCNVCQNQYLLCNSEAFWINIVDQTDSSYVNGVIYCQSSQVLVNAFIEDLSNCLTYCNKYNINYFILGDLNINASASNR